MSGEVKSGLSTDIPTEVALAAGNLTFAERSGDEYRYGCPTCNSRRTLSIRYNGPGKRVQVYCFEPMCASRDNPKAFFQLLRAQGSVLYGDNTYYIFQLVDGTPVYREHYIRRPDGSKITPLERFKRMSGNGVPEYIKGSGCMRGVERILFQLPQLAAHPNEPVWFHEGPKKALIAAENGLLSTSIAGGANGSWPSELSSLSGRRINWCLDYDEAGFKGALVGYEKLKGIASEIHFYRAKYGTDAWDHFSYGGTADEFTEVTLAELKELIATAAETSVTIVCTHHKDTALGLEKSLHAGKLPDVYQRNDELIQLRNSARTVPLTPAGFQLSAALHLTLVRSGPKGETIPAWPPESVFRAAISGGVSHGWQVPELRRVIQAPMLRSDGSLLQRPGYDVQSKLYLREHNVPSVSTCPSAEEVAEAKDFLLSRLLHDFPWRAESDRANYLAMLFTPVLYDYIDGLIPLFVMDAPMAGSGKTLLSDIISVLYSNEPESYAWVDKDEEVEKRITAILRSTDSPVVVFDNVGARDKIYQPAFAKLFTGRWWSGRKLGVGETIKMRNDRIWIATGRNIQLDGDMSSRSVVCRIEPGDSTPEKRTDFVLGDLFIWLSDNSNVDYLRYSLLTLASAWLNAGAPIGSGVLRQFTRWTSVVSGLLSWLNVPGFLAATSASAGLSEEDVRLYAFYERWWELSRRSPAGLSRRAAELIAAEHRFGELFPIDTSLRGSPVIRLGKLLQRADGKWIGEYKITSDPGRHGNVWTLTRRADKTELWK